MLHSVQAAVRGHDDNNNNMSHNMGQLG